MLPGGQNRPGCTEEMIDQYYRALAEELIVSSVNRLMDDRNALHVCGLLLTRYTQLPIIKRDLVFRNVHRESALEDFAQDNAPELAGYIRENNRAKGNSKYYIALRRLLLKCNIL